MTLMIFFAQISLVIILGLVFGSFATAIAYRVPRGISWITASDRKSEDKSETGVSKRCNAARSECMACHTSLAIVDLVPIFSWLFLRGRCRYCKETIGRQYFLIELMTLVASIGVYMSFGLSITTFIVIVSIPFMVALIFIDIEYMILPNQLVLILAVIGVLFISAQGINEDIMDVISDKFGGAVVFGGCAWLLRAIMYQVTKKDALGFGDIKFFMVAGLWLGLGMLPYFMIISGSLGVIFGLIWQLIKKSNVFPFGPALIVTFYILTVFSTYVGILFP